MGKFFLLLIVSIAGTIIESSAQSQACSHPFSLVILGSSTSAGAGASPSDSAYVKRFSKYLQDSVNSGCIVTNLAVGGYNTRKIQPAWFGGSVDTAKNIDKALSLNPDALLINMPSNDAASGFTLSEQKANFLRVMAKADSFNVPVWITTTQPRNLSAAGRDSLTHMKNWIMATFPDSYIDFWTGIAAADGSILAAYNSGDGVHLNNAGHRILFNRVISSNLIDSLCTDTEDTATSIVVPMKQLAAQVYLQNRQVVIEMPEYSDCTYTVYNLNGIKIREGKISASRTLVPLPIQDQMYLLRINKGNISRTFKLSKF
ncbi:MAG: hypothetical protein JNM21_02780 [Taibaiella sp.]|nr:hypothetical protein [Taibaiella sp.]